MDAKEREKLYKTMEEIVEKYKNKELLHKKLKRALLTFNGNRFVDPKIYKELANLTVKINFRCHFKNGKCSAGRTKMCCCANCVQYFGHFQTVFFSAWSKKEAIEEEMLYYTKRFNFETGFWRENKGCILPRHKRSQTCLAYNCNSDKLTKEEKLLLNIIGSYERYPPYISGIIDMLKDYFLYREE